VIDLNDFDEAHPGGWEWDLRRLAASFWVAGRHNGTSEQPCGNAVRSCVASYRHELRRLADLPLFTRSFVSARCRQAGSGDRRRSSKLAGRCWGAMCTVNRHGTRTRGSGWCSTSSRRRR
jgi:hypothetical protein